MKPILPDDDPSQYEDILNRLRALEQARDGVHGTGTVTWPGASTTSNQLPIPHGLNVLPRAAHATHKSQTGTGFCWVECNFDATNVYVRLSTPSFQPPNTTTSTISWSAWP